MNPSNSKLKIMICNRLNVSVNIEPVAEKMPVATIGKIIVGRYDLSSKIIFFIAVRVMSIAVTKVNSNLSGITIQPAQLSLAENEVLIGS